MKKRIRICKGNTCGHFGKDLLDSAKKKIQKENLSDRILAEECHCLGECMKGPNIQIENAGRRETKSKMNKKALEKEIDSLSGKTQIPLQKPGEAKNTLNSLLSGGF